MTDHHGIGRSGTLYARGNIGGLSQRQQFLPLCSTHFPNKASRQNKLSVYVFGRMV
jgi:hypothetical protein